MVAPLAASNARVKEARKLSPRPARAERRLFLADGPKAVEGALGVHGCVVEVFATPAAAEQYAALLAGAEATLVDDRAMASLSDSVTPAGLVAVCRFLEAPEVEVPAERASRTLVVICADVRDPGNAGTVIRTADAVAADAVVLAGQSVDPYNPKTVRASVGSLFHLPVLRERDVPTAVAAAREAGLAVLAADASGTVVLVSAMAGRMLGVRPGDALGRPLRDVLALTDNEGRDWCHENQPFDGLPTRTGVPEQSWLLPNGTEVLTTARIGRAGRTGPVEQVSVVIRSGRGRARLDRERSDLVATVAHELRSPLTGVKGFVQAMLNRWDRLTDEQKKLMLTTVHADSDRLSRLIAELLDVARIDTGRLSLQPRPCDARQLVQRVVDSVSAGTARPVAYAAADDLPQVMADPDKFTQVVTNVVENAVRHGSGNVTVTLSALIDPEHPGVRLVVEDEGEGIPEEMRRRVFTKFWTGGVRGGSGLGLYLVHGLCRAHGGTVTIGDTDGGGARITIEWPAPTGILAEG